MKTYEVTLSGFDASTDATDHLILWIVAPSREAVQKHLEAEGKEYVCIEQLPPSYAHSGAIDATLPDEDGTGNFLDSLRHFSTLYY